MAEILSSAVRSPLAEATNRVNNSAPTPAQQQSKPRHHGLIAAVTMGNPQKISSVQHSTAPNSAAPSQAKTTATNVHHYPVTQPTQAPNDTRRYSQASYASTSSSHSRRSYKTHVGPWQLGKTLGKGSSARVRLCRHIHTNQLAAVKIVNRRMAYLVQDSSLAALSKWDSSLPEQINGEIRVPMAIEREVAILKLIEHPNIMKLYDIWENRSEIYLILEYIDQGDLFTFINSRGRLTEEAALYFFRQIISAMTYCHSFNICHRDLKPENILISADFQIKIADFGMAALHQTDTHQLATACGSPHYAAPELLKNRQYRGDKADIWSMGVILYAMLSASLPFDDPDLRVMMAKTKKGHYDMPKFLSPEAEDLISRMLQVNPDRRVSLKQIWRHPLVQKYSYLDDLGDNSGQPPDTRKGFQYTPVPRQQIDSQLLRQLRSMWHMFSESDLALKLSCEEPNDQKAFYWLLHTYREKQLEDFKPELAHSMSDYHHLKPGVWKKRVSTCQFAQPGPNGRVRSVSRFTVISRTAETETETVQSYDPYRDSRMLRTCGSQASPAKITIHQDTRASNDGYGSQYAKPRGAPPTQRGRPVSRNHGTTIRPRSSKGSVTSLHSSHQGTPRTQGRNLRHKRAVDFSHIKKRSPSLRKVQQVADHPIVPAAHLQVESARLNDTKGDRLATKVHPQIKDEPQHQLKKNASTLFHEELRNLSSNVARDCDEAFNSSLIDDVSIAGSLTDGCSKHLELSPATSSRHGTDSDSNTLVTPITGVLESRPLPPLPVESPTSTVQSITSFVAGTSIDSVHQMKKGMEECMENSNGTANTPVPPAPRPDRRIVSVPIYCSSVKKSPGALPSITEDSRSGATNQDKGRTVSAPPHTPRQVKEREHNMQYLMTMENTIRVVQSPTTVSPVKAPKPLNVQKRIVTGSSEESAPEKSLVSAKDHHTRNQHRLSSLGSHEGSKKKKSSWFKRLSKSETEHQAHANSEGSSNAVLDSKDRHQSESEVTESFNKKKGFNFTFWKTNKSKETAVSVEDGREDSLKMEQASDHTEIKKTTQSSWRDSASDGVRNIEVKQNWLARLFRVKPATSYLCMVISRKRARQEIAILFREWRTHGIRGIQVDKNRNIVFARVGAKNILNLKEVEFAAEIMTVIEHGKKQPLCIVRLTQERGAASSFHKVVETMKVVFGKRNLLVTDKGRQRMMIKTLNSSSTDNDMKSQ